MYRRTAGALMLALAATVAGSVPAAAEAVAGWTVEKIPKFTTANDLVAVTALNPTDAWSVGSRTTAEGAEASLTLHWDGRTWTNVPSPGASRLNGVSASGSADVWAVGSTIDGARSVIQRWNGRAWSLVEHVAATPASPLTLSSVLALGTGNAVAVGFRGDGLVTTPHAQHWDGRRWVERPVPNPDGAAVMLTSVVAGPTGPYATGFVVTPDFTFRPYVARWDGVRWTSLKVPATISGAFADLVVLAPDRFVAVGSDLVPTSPDPVPVVVSYSGGTWTRETVPVANAELDAVTVDRRGNLLAAGARIGPGGHDDRQPLVLRRQPHGWSAEPLPPTGAAGIRDLAAVPGSGTALAVGATGVTDETHRSLVLRRPGPAG